MLFDDPERLIFMLISVALVTISASLHEFGHAWMAHVCGDATAKEQGRLTVNPLAHIDPFGSVLLPLLLVLTSGSYIAFAKPVPFNPYRLKNPERDEALVALAGPVANLIQAGVAAVVFHLYLLVFYGHSLPMWYYDTSPAAWAGDILSSYVVINCMLAFFNLIPIPPLDGSKLLSPLFKGQARRVYEQVQHYAMPITLALIWVLPSFAGIDPLGWLLDLTAGNLAQLLLFGGL